MAAGAGHGREQGGAGRGERGGTGRLAVVRGARGLRVYFVKSVFRV